MSQVLHGSARTTEAVRRAIQVGTARHFAPFVHRQMMTSTVRSRSEGSTLAWGGRLRRGAPTPPIARPSTPPQLILRRSPRHRWVNGAGEGVQGRR